MPPLIRITDIMSPETAYVAATEAECRDETDKAGFRQVSRHADDGEIMMGKILFEPVAHAYKPGLEVNVLADRLHPNNCAVILRTGDGVSVGACWHHLRGGTTCPSHGVVKLRAEPQMRRFGVPR